MDPKIIGPQQLLDPKIWIQKLLDPQKIHSSPGIGFSHQRRTNIHTDFLMPDAVNFGITAPAASNRGTTKTL